MKKQFELNVIDSEVQVFWVKPKDVEVVSSRLGMLVISRQRLHPAESHSRFFHKNSTQTNFYRNLRIGKAMDTQMKAHWVRISKLIAETGRTDDAIRKKQRTYWQFGLHWRKTADARIYFDLIIEPDSTHYPSADGG